MISQTELQTRKLLAKTYLSLVEGEMALSKSDLRHILRDNLDKLIETCEKYRHLQKGFHFACDSDLEKEIDKLLKRMGTDIFNTIYLRAENVSRIAYVREKENWNRELSAAFMISKIAGKTLSERIHEYTDRLKYELEAYIAIAFTNNLSSSSIIHSYLQYADKPYKSQIIQNAFSETGFKASRLASKGITLGNGVYTSAFNGLNMLEKDMIFKTYNHSLQYLWQTNGVLGWITVRGSGFVCNRCDSMTGIFHPISESYPGYHPNCMCLMIPIYKTDF